MKLRRLSFLLFCLAFLWASPKQAEEIRYDELESISAALRVGDGERAGAMLHDFSPNKSEEAIYHLLLGWSETLKGDGEAAGKQFRSIKGAIPEGLKRSRDWWAFQAALEGKTGIFETSQAILNDKNASYERRGEAELAQIDLKLQNPRKKKAAMAALQKLSRVGGPVMIPKALERLAREGDQAASRRLLIEFGATAEGQRWASETDLSRLTLDQTLERARNLFSMRAYEWARPDFERILKKGSPGMQQEAASRLASICLRLFENYDDALKYLDRVAEGPSRDFAASSFYSRAMVLGRMGQYEASSASAKKYIDKMPDGKYVTEARFLIARNAHREQKYAEAIQAMEELLEHKPSDPPKWKWFLAWSLYMGRETGRARGMLLELSKNRNLLIGPKALYWLARLEDREGNENARDAALDELLNRAPDSYYGILAARLKAEVTGQKFEIKRTDAPLKPIDCSFSRLRAALNGPEQKRFDQMALSILAGELSYARELGEKLPKQLVTMPEFSFCIDQKLERFGSRWKKESQRRLPWVEGMRQKPEQARREAYPEAYKPLALASGQIYGVPRFWLWAHMLQESRFKARQISGAGALGLMQILPRTGIRIADQIHFPRGDFFDGTLSLPEVAIRQAAYYLNALRMDFGQAMPMAIASYNGGPRRVGAHVAEQLRLRSGQISGVSAYAEVIEEMDAHETRNYVRKVTDHAIRFAWLYGTDEELNDLARQLTPESLTSPKGEIRY